MFILFTGKLCSLGGRYFFREGFLQQFFYLTKNNNNNWIRDFVMSLVNGANNTIYRYQISGNDQKPIKILMQYFF